MNEKAVERTVYSLRELLSTLDPPQQVSVSEGSSSVDISTGDVILIRQKKQMKYVLGVTFTDKRQVYIPLDCELKTEIPHAQCMNKSIETVEKLTSKSILHHVKYVRVLSDYQRDNNNKIKKGEILQLLFCNGENLVTINSQGCEVNLSLSCSAGFHLLNDKKEYTLKELLDEDMLPRFLRFVQPVPWNVRETFIEDNHICDLGVFYVEKETHEKQVVEVIFNAEGDEESEPVWLSLDDSDITVSPLRPDQVRPNTEIASVGSTKSAEKIGHCLTRSSQSESRSGQPESGFGQPESRSGQPESRFGQTESRSGQTKSKRDHTGSRPGEHGSSVVSSLVPTATKFSQNTSKSAFKLDQSNFDKGHLCCNSGQSGSNPCQSGFNPAQSGSNPGQSGSNSGQSGSNSGQSGSNSGQSGSNPGQSGSNPGQSGSNSGQSGSNSGQSGSNSGQSGSSSPQISHEQLFASKPNEQSCNSSQSASNPGQSCRNIGQTCSVTGTASSEPNKELRNIVSAAKKYVERSFKKTGDEDNMANEHKNTKNKKTKRTPTDELPSLPVAQPWSDKKRNHQGSNYKQTTAFPGHLKSSRPATTTKAYDVYPSDLSDLSVEDVEVLLGKLNLGSHAKMFADELIDGAMLMQLDDVMLMEHFGFTKFHAIKLNKFVKGYRPNLQ